MIDLHIHSRYSEDGELTPAQLVEMCAAQGITMMSITDHNCARANWEAETLAKEKGISYISGIEIDCTFHGVGFHVLGYGINHHSKDFAQIEENVVSQAKTASLNMFFKTLNLGFHITMDDMWRVSQGAEHPEIWTGDIFAEVLLAKPEYIDHPLLAPYRPGGNRSDNPYVNFYWDYYAQGKPCHVKMEYPSMEEAIRIIHKNQGIAVLAHPAMNLKGNEHLLSPLLKMKFDGIEAFSSYHTPMQTRFYYGAACASHMLATCGSDYHGKTKPSVKLGGYPTLPDVSTDEIEDTFIKEFPKKLAI